jgi:cytidylate kinase
LIEPQVRTEERDVTLPNIIAIDGPAASGKSTLGSKLAAYLGYLSLDTGVMYRALTWAALKKGIPPADEAAVSELAWKADIDVRPASVEDGRPYDVLADGVDVTWEIRSPEVDAHVSQVSAYPEVRQAMTEQQRRIGRRGKIIMIGRDIGTVVFPEADLKIYLVASLEERARRRYHERLSRGETVSFGEIMENVRHRDEIDSTRTVAPLRPADDAVILNSDGLDEEQVFEAARRLLE